MPCERTEAKLALDQSLCRVDAWTFEHIVGSIEQAAVEGSPARAIDLYRGLFMANKDDPWLITARKRLFSKFVRSIGAYSAKHGSTGNGTRRVPGISAESRSMIWRNRSMET